MFWNRKKKKDNQANTDGNNQAEDKVEAGSQAETDLQTFRDFLEETGLEAGPMFDDLLHPDGPPNAADKSSSYSAANADKHSTESRYTLLDLINLYFDPDSYYIDSGGDSATSDPADKDSADDDPVWELWDALEAMKTLESGKEDWDVDTSEAERKKNNTRVGWTAAVLGRVMTRDGSLASYKKQMAFYDQMKETYNNDLKSREEIMEQIKELRKPLVDFLLKTSWGRELLSANSSNSQSEDSGQSQASNSNNSNKNGSGVDDAALKVLDRAAELALFEDIPEKNLTVQPNRAVFGAEVDEEVKKALDGYRKERSITPNQPLAAKYGVNSITYQITIIVEKFWIQTALREECGIIDQDLFEKLVNKASKLERQNLDLWEQIEQLEEKMQTWPEGYRPPNSGYLPVGELISLLGDSGGSYDRFVKQGILMGMQGFLYRYREDETAQKQLKYIKEYKDAQGQKSQLSAFEVRVPEEIDDQTYAKVLTVVLEATNPEKAYVDTDILLAQARDEVPGVMELLKKYPLRIIDEKNEVVNGFIDYNPYEYSFWVNYSPPLNEGPVHRRYLEAMDMLSPNSSGINASLFTRQYAAIPTLFHENEHFLGDLNETSVHVKSYLFSKGMYSRLNPELAIYDGTFLTMHKILGRKLTADTVYQVNDKIELSYGAEMSAEEAEEYTDKFIDQMNSLIRGNNLGLTWHPEVAWPMLTEEEDRVNLHRLRTFLIGHYSRKNSLLRSEFLQILEDYKAQTALRATSESDLNQEEKSAAEQSRIKLFSEGTMGQLVQYKEKGETPIEWIALGDVANGTAFISKKALSVRRFHGSLSSVSWADSEIREWLSSFFIRKVFSKAERSLLEVSTLANGLEEDSDDRIFLLGLDEIELLGENRETEDIDTLTLPPILHPNYGTTTATRKPENNAWWLRSQGEDETRAVVIYYHGAIHKPGYHKYKAKCGIRPVIVVKRATDSSDSSAV